MSSRVLKKLHGDKELDILDQDSDIDNDNSLIGPSGTQKKRFDNNRYDLFQQSMSESEVKEDDNETEHNSTAAPSRSEPKKKRKKRKKRSGKQGNHRSSEDNADIDELARTFKEINQMVNDENKPLPGYRLTTTNKSIPVKQLLNVQHKNLNPSLEMKRMFGCKVVQIKHSNERRNGRGQHRLFKSTWLVTPKDTWPATSKTGLSMSIDPDKSNEAEQGQSSSTRNTGKVQWFKFEHSSNYRILQKRFMTAVESMDSDNIIAIINEQPYHIDSLIQLSELCKMSEDNAMASELIEHAILALEIAFHPSFSLTSGNSRLDYRCQTNRALFVVLFKHAQYLEGRACARTALEISKLILSLDPDNDPLAMILVVDYFALRSKQYEWLIELYEEWESKNNLSQLPNMAYSYALALFYKHKGGNLELADKYLQYAVFMFPGVVKTLLDAISVQIDARANNHSYISSVAFEKQSPALQQLVYLYVIRIKTIWRDSDVLPWFERNVKTVLDRCDRNDPMVLECSTKRSQRYKTPPRAILRHIILSDFKEKVPLAPFIDKDTEPILMYDPLPPSDSINLYLPPTLPSASRLIPDTSPLSMFFRTMMPNFNVENTRFVAPEVLAGEQADRNDQDQAAAINNDVLINEMRLIAAINNDAGVGVVIEPLLELRNSLTSVVDAMRNFLTTIRVPELGNEADEDNESTDDGAHDDYLT